MVILFVVGCSCKNKFEMSLVFPARLTGTEQTWNPRGIGPVPVSLLTLSCLQFLKAKLNPPRCHYTAYNHAEVLGV